MSFDQILKRGILAAAPLGVVNCHAGALPFYRGCNPINWAIINGETRFGVTVHAVDEGIDTGDVILQTFAPIGPDDTYADRLAAAHGLCADTLHEALVSIADGTARRTPRPPSIRSASIADDDGTAMNGSDGAGPVSASTTSAGPSPGQAPARAAWETRVPSRWSPPR